MTQFTFAQAEAVLTDLNRIAPDKRVAFSARLKNLQKQGLGREVSKPGKGKAATMTFAGLIQTAFAIEMIRLGLPPQRAAKISSEGWTKIMHSIVYAVYPQVALDRENEKRGTNLTSKWVWRVHYDALDDMAETPHRTENGFFRVNALRADEVQTIFEFESDQETVLRVPLRRALLVNGTMLVRAVFDLVTNRFNYATELQLLRELEVAIMEEAYFIGAMVRSEVPHEDQASLEGRARGVIEDYDNIRALLPETARDAEMARAISLRAKMTKEEVEYLKVWPRGVIYEPESPMVAAAMSLVEKGVFVLSGRQTSLSVTVIGVLVLKLVQTETADVDQEA